MRVCVAVSHHGEQRSGLRHGLVLELNDGNVVESHERIDIFGTVLSERLLVGKKLPEEDVEQTVVASRQAV